MISEFEFFKMVKEGKLAVGEEMDFTRAGETNTSRGKVEALNPDVVKIDHWENWTVPIGKLKWRVETETVRNAAGEIESVKYHDEKSLEAALAKREQIKARWAASE